MADPTEIPTDAPPFDWDAILRTLAASRRRNLLIALEENGNDGPINELIRRVEAYERNVPVESVTDDVVEAARVPMRHNHIPALVEQNLVQWVDDRQRLALTKTALSHPVALPLARWSNHPAITSPMINEPSTGD